MFNDRLNVSALPLLSVNQPHLECQGLLLSLPDTRPTFILNCYRPPDADINQATLSVSNLLNSLDGIDNKDILVLGDWHIDLLAKSPGRVVFNCMLSTQALTQIIKIPTRISLVKSSLLDVICTNNTGLYINLGVISLGLSDHNLIVVSRKGPKKS